jgi:hypothetical protein
LGLLNQKNVYNGFGLLLSLKDRQCWSNVLSVHGGEQSARFKFAMQERNDKIQLYGQEEL